MEFNKTVLIIATVLLIITLTILAIMLYNSHGGLQFPPEIGHCPDFWTLNKKDGNKSMCRNVQHLGKCGGGTADCCEENGKNVCCPMDPTQWGKGKHANKKKCEWAKDCGLTWDGITNGNYC